MKKALLWLLLLTVPFTFGCPTPQNNNAGNVNSGNTNAVNTNAGNTNGDASVLARDRRNKAIQIVVYEGENGERRVAIAPERIKLSLNKDHRLRFSIFNGLDVDINSIRVVLTGTGDGFEGGDDEDGAAKSKIFRRGEIPTGTEDDTKGNFRKPKGQGTYTFKVYIDGQEAETKTEKLYVPQIEIGG